MSRLILASSSAYRKQLLARLTPDFECIPPRIDESRLPDEPAGGMVKRLARSKAEAVGVLHADALIIGSDQCAVFGESILGKPGGFDNARAQLTQASGRTTVFHTGLCLLNGRDGSIQVDDIECHVRFRVLTDRQIRAYLEREKPWECAGSIRSEGLGIALFEHMRGDDSSALMGLPLIRLVTMLTRAGCPIL